MTGPERKTVRAEAYLRIVGDEGTVRTIAKEIGSAKAIVQQTNAKITPSSDDTWWNWRTEPVPIDIDNADEGLRALLLAYRPSFPALKKHENAADLYLELVTRCEPGEDPAGLFLSAETLQLLNEMGGAFDHDVVVVTEAEGRNV